MSIKIGINGFGRIGRTILRNSLLSPWKDALEVCHINDLTDLHTIAHLLRYDSVHGRLDAEVQVIPEGLKIAGKSVTVSSTKSPKDLPWASVKPDIVFECTGLFTKREDCDLHLQAGATRVLVSAPATGEDMTVVYGVNHKALTQAARVVSNGSCTTNCLAPVVQVLHEALHVRSGLMTTVHSYTNDQNILDLPHKDLRRARAGALSMIPTSTGAAKAIGLVLPELKGKIDGIAVRVPTPNVSLVDVTLQVEKQTTVAEVNLLLKTASQGRLQGVLGYSEEPLVSIDYNGSCLSSVIDAGMTKVAQGTQVKVLAWYDNETGFSARMLDVARLWTSN